MQISLLLTDAARSVFVRALGIGSELAVLVAAGVRVFGAEEASIAFFFSFDTEVATEGLFRLREATTGFREENLKRVEGNSKYVERDLRWKTNIQMRENELPTVNYMHQGARA